MSDDWEVLLTKGLYNDIALRLINDCASFDFDALRSNTYVALQQSNEVHLSLQDGLAYGCGGGGYYRAKPPIIYLHPSILRRDNFTLLHELGHHIQIRHEEWSFILLDLPRDSRRHTEEAVCDQFASCVLMPWDGGTLDNRECHPADLMAGLFAETNASRSAVMTHVKKLFPASAKWILAVAAVDGRVQSSATTYSDYPPPKGVIQPESASLAAEAVNGRVCRSLSEGIRYNTGSILDGMRAEATLDHEGRYLFVALTPLARFGTGRITRQVLECSNPPCERTFDASEVAAICGTCAEPRCPHCSSCSCAMMDSGQLCPKCYLVVSPGEVANGSHECW